MLDWLDQVQQRLTGYVHGAVDLGLSPADIEALLELARTASHESGDRTNAPLVAYLVGLAHGCNPDKELQNVIAAALGRPEREGM